VSRALALVALVAPALAAAGVRPAYGGTVRVGVASAPAPGAPCPVDPLVDRATSAPLLDVDAAGTLVPGALAEVPVAEAGARAYRLRVRPGLTDAAGRALGAPDVAARLAAVLAPGAPAADRWVALPILGAEAFAEGRAPILAGVQVLSPGELLVSLAFPLPELPWLLAAPALALPGAGPFTASPRAGPCPPAQLRANDRHHRGRPFASELRVEAVDARAAARQLDQGALGLVLRPEGAGPRVLPLAPLAVTVAAVQPARLGAGAPAVRAALGAVDRADLARRFVRGPAEPLRTFVPPALLPSVHGPAEPLRTFVPPALLPGARAEPPPPAGPAPSAKLVLLADASEPEQRAIAERLQVKLFDRGVRVSVELVDGARHRARVAAGDYDVALVTVRVQALRPALAAAQVADAVRGADAARRTLAALAGLEGDAALAAAAEAARALDVVPLVATGLRASFAPSVQGVSPLPDGGVDPGALWVLGAAGLTAP
jgi:peptide/nickel transport system substrate-binding protein